ncbi:MAG: hypothetical protein P8J32_02735 [bacterium]|nr:hypothetical protein [bacterium]
MKDRLKNHKRDNSGHTTPLTERKIILWERALRDARNISLRAHLMQDWGGWNYQVHLDRVDDVICDFGFGDKTMFGYRRRIAAIFHDMIEDCGWTYNDIKDFVNSAVGTTWGAGETVANICYALTDEKGRNRAERKPEKLYDEMAEERDYIVGKNADRIVNRERAGMGVTYDKEYPDYRKKLYKPGDCDNMWAYLDELHSFQAVTA